MLELTSYPFLNKWRGVDPQKPPGIHLTYALMFGPWRNESVVAGTDLAVEALVAWLLVLSGRRFSRQGREGHLAAVSRLGKPGVPSARRRVGQGATRDIHQPGRHWGCARAAARRLAAILPLTYTNSWPHPGHIPELALFSAGCLAVVRSRDAMFAAVLVLAALDRETSAFVCPYPTGSVVAWSLNGTTLTGGAWISSGITDWKVE